MGLEIGLQSKSTCCSCRVLGAEHKGTYVHSSPEKPGMLSNAGLSLRWEKYKTLFFHPENQ